MRQIVEVFFGKDEILVKLWFKGLNYHNFYIFDNIKTDRYLNSFQQHLFGLLRLKSTIFLFNPILDGVRVHPILDGGGAKKPPVLTLPFSVWQQWNLVGM